MASIPWDYQRQRYEEECRRQMYRDMQAMSPPSSIRMEPVDDAPKKPFKKKLLLCN